MIIKKAENILIYLLAFFAVTFVVLIFAYFSVELLSFSVADFSELFAGYEKINPLPVIN